MSMQSFKAIVIHAKSGNQDIYHFEAEAGIFDKHRHHLFNAFAAYVDNDLIPEEKVIIEAQAVLKDRDHRVLTIVGQLVTEHGEIPFMAMINEE